MRTARLKVANVLAMISEGKDTPEGICSKLKDKYGHCPPLSCRAGPCPQLEWKPVSVGAEPYTITKSLGVTIRLYDQSSLADGLAPFAEAMIDFRNLCQRVDKLSATPSVKRTCWFQLRPFAGKGRGGSGGSGNATGAIKLAVDVSLAAASP